MPGDEAGSLFDPIPSTAPTHRDGTGLFRPLTSVSSMSWSWSGWRAETLFGSTEYNVDLAFNSLDAQREACEAYTKSHAHDSWRLIPGRYDDGAFSGASLERPALQQLLANVRAGKIDIVLVSLIESEIRGIEN
jgi:hypothetical protein